jgi:hypothetical protein
VLSSADLLIGALAALIVGLSKTAIPGAGLLATPLVAIVFDGRQIAGATLLILLTADVFAVRWYRRHTRWDLLRPLAPWVGLGYVVGAWFFIAVGSGGRTLDITMGVTILSMVLLQGFRMIRRLQPAESSHRAAAFYGSTGGFATFVSNNAGPILNTHLLRLGLGKEELVGTSAWFYFVANLSKLPFYLALGWWASGGPFFTAETLKFDLLLVPVVVVGVLLGRRIFSIVPTQLFVVIVLVLAGAASVKLLAG